MASSSQGSSPPEKETLTPMMAQYIEIRQANPDTLLFYRLGDFYELFFEDAEIASRVLGIALTTRGNHKGKPIPLAGVPYHAATDYLHKLIDAGYKVAICEQVEDPAEAKKRGAKAVVRREVRRIATPGTLTEDSLLKARDSNYLLALLQDHSCDPPLFALAWTDISTGEFHFSSLSRTDLVSELSRLKPREILLRKGGQEGLLLEGLLSDKSLSLTTLEPDSFDSEAAKDRLARFYDLEDKTILNSHRRAELSVAGAILSYIETTQRGAVPALRLPEKQETGAQMGLDGATLSNLEILTTTAGEKRGSLLSVIDVCITGAGSRTMARRLGAPLIDSQAINKRLETVDFLYQNRDLTRDIRRHLTQLPDIARALSRLSLERGEPRDLAAIGDGLQVALTMRSLLPSLAHSGHLTRIKCCLDDLDEALLTRLKEALSDSLPTTKRDGGFIRPGFDPDLDEARRLRDNSRQLIAALQSRYSDDTAIKTLKIKHNAMLNYFIEVPSRQGEELLAAGREGDSPFIHRQSMANAHRFTTRELEDLQGRIFSASEQALERELALFNLLSETVLSATKSLQVLAEALAELDVHAALAHIADQENWIKPVVNDSLDFMIEAGRHPVVEQAVRRDGEKPFIANDCCLSDEHQTAGRIMMLTGPNMAGKSTFLRQNALITILAQMGSFVPCQKVVIGTVDRLFSRVGASDDLARGRSTFMVEMVETATILNQSSPRSLVILDEIGRGTATFDGLSIAWASIEHLHEVNHCRCLFATHFHELTVLERKLERLSNATIRVREWKHDVVFLHEVVAGVAAGSYGIQVARLAGLPASVISRARDVLAQLEKEERANPVERMIDDLPLFAQTGDRAETDQSPAAAIISTLAAIDVDGLSPRQALDQLFSLAADARRINTDPSQL